MRLTVKERILLHLLDLSTTADPIEVSPAVTQEGIARASWIDVPHVTQYVRPMVEEGLVRLRTTHVKGARRRRKVYDLTDVGKLRAIRLREQVKSESVRMRDNEEIREANVSQVIEQAEGKVSVLDVVRQVMHAGFVDLASLVPSPVISFVEMLSDAPHPRTFVGRVAELEMVTRDGEGPKIFVVRGVAGIGKSSLGAKACERLRGKRSLFWHRVRPWDTSSSILADVGDFLSAHGKPGLHSVLLRGETARAAEVLREDLFRVKAFLVFDDAHEASKETMGFFPILKEAVLQAPDVRAMVLTREAMSFYDRRDVILTELVVEIELPGLSPSEVAALASHEPDAPRLIDLGNKLGGHPLFLELARAQHAVPAEAIQSVHRFIEEEIYAKLSKEERAVMKTACLYGVPVPRDALFAYPDLSADVLISLSNRSLIRTLAGDRFEVHDTIEEFFASALTTDERRQIGAFAVQQLRQLASKANEARDFVSSIDYLSNALRLSKSIGERRILLEALGDAYEEMGDLSATLTAYREAATAAEEPEVRARLHRKIAWALLDRGELKAASAETEEGARALGITSSVERGWLDLIRCHLAQASADWEEARDHGESALRTFQGFQAIQGRAEASLALGQAEAWKPQEDIPLAERYLREALELSGSVRDPRFTARLHFTMANFCLNIALDIERAERHLAAIEAMPEVRIDPLIRRDFLSARANFHLLFQADFPAAEADFMELMAVASKIHDAAALTEAKVGLAQLLYYQGPLGQARRDLEEVADEYLALGLAGGAIGMMFYAAECCLLEDDLEGFRRIVDVLDEPKFLRDVRVQPYFVSILHGLDRLANGDRGGSRTAFEEALRLEKGTVKAPAQFSSFYYSIALRVMGEDREAERHLRLFIEVAEKLHRKARLSIVHERERRLVEVLRRATTTT
ncbi:MAG TPA: hypothetical protein VJ224_05660 [Thermoplasmata archaeon]|nr:hypothetical protein [Thermoplasmata archaeon]